MPAVRELSIAGEPVVLCADRALFWPARGRLLVADLHLGKGNILRAAGIAVPSGGTAHDLARLSALVAETGAAELWVLGDFLHGARHGDVERAWREWLAAQAGLTVGVVTGNHDRALETAALGVERLPDDVREGPFRFRHDPPPPTDLRPGHVVCGHVHPVAKLPGLRGRWPAFVLDPAVTVLPAFSAFTGGWRIDQDAARWVACADGVLAGVDAAQLR